MNGICLPSDDNYNHFICIYIPVLHMFLEDNLLLNSNYPVYYDGIYTDVVKKYTKNVFCLNKAPQNTPMIEYHPNSLNKDLNEKVRNTLMLDFKSQNPNGAIFIKRKNRKLKNYNQIISVIKNFGISIEEVEFENMLFKDQMEISNSSKFMFGVHGAGLTNLMFMHQDSNILEIDPFDWGFNCYEHLAKNLEMKNFIRICQPITKDKYIQEFEINIKIFEEKLNSLV